MKANGTVDGRTPERDGGQTQRQGELGLMQTPRKSSRGPSKGSQEKSSERRPQYTPKYHKEMAPQMTTLLQQNQQQKDMQEGQKNGKINLGVKRGQYSDQQRLHVEQVRNEVDQRINEVEGQLAQISLIKHMRKNSNVATNAKPPLKLIHAKKANDARPGTFSIKTAVSAAANQN